MALSFADPSFYPEVNSDSISVLLKIELKHRKNFFIYEESVSAFSEEQEVIL